MVKIRIAIFASGSGTNAEAIVNHFAQHKFIEVSLICTNNPNAFVLTRAKTRNIDSFVFSKNDLVNNRVEDKLRSENIQFIVLAGFLLLIPLSLINNFPNKIVNIHPALLPKYGGKGMYGTKVHEAVKLANEKISGITIHFVNQQYDEGDIIAQFQTNLLESDTPNDIANKIHLLEHQHFPSTIEKVIRTLG